MLYDLPTATFSLNSSNILCEEDQVVDGDDPGGLDPRALTDDDLKAALIQHGAKVGPIVGRFPLGFRDSVAFMKSFIRY